MPIEEANKFEKIYENYWRLAYSIALKVLRSEADAEDVVQQTFLYLFRNLDKVRDVDSEPGCGRRKVCVLNLDIRCNESAPERNPLN